MPIPSSEAIADKLFNIITFNLEDKSPAHRMGASIDGQASIEFLGDMSNPHTATLFVAVPKHEQTTIARNAALAIAFIEAIFPDWKKAQDWLNDNLGSNEANIRYARSRLEINLRKMDGGVFLTVSA